MASEQLTGSAEESGGIVPADRPVAGSLQTALTSDRLFEAGRSIGVATLAGGLAGLLAAGAGSRLAMRASGFMFARDNPGSLAFTESGAKVGEITAGGTIFLLLFGTVLGLMGAYFYATLKPWLPGRALVRGLLFGLVALAILSPFALERGNDDFQRLGDVRVNVALFALLFIVYGLLISLLDAGIDRVLPKRVARSWPGLTQAIRSIVLIGGIALSLFMIQSLVVFMLAAIVGADSEVERLQHGLILVATLTLFPIYLFLRPIERDGGSHALNRRGGRVQKIVYGGFASILLACAAATVQAVVTILNA